MTAWEALLEPIRIGALTAKNRVEAAPTLTNLANADQSVSRDLVEFYRAQAKGGAGIITVLETAIDSDRAITQPVQLNLGHDRYIPGMTSIVEAIRSHGALASIQLNHGGRQAAAALNTGGNPIGPSAMTGHFTEDRRRPEQTIEGMSLEMIEEVIEHYAAAAFRAQIAGFDMVMVHGGHGWLISQFLSPVANLRTDEYGGSLENRARFAVRVVEAIKERCGQDFPIELRIGASDLVPGGMEIEDAIAFARLMKDKVDCFQVSAGMISEARTYPYTHPSCYLPHGENVERAAQIKRAVDIPVAAVGAIVDLEEAGEWVADGKTDIVALCRALIADPELPKKTFRGRKREVIPCIRCNTCLIRGAHSLPVRCTTNPWSVREEYYRCLPPARSKKRVLVVGGGPAGMEAALVASWRGHEVTLLEKEAQCGGNLSVACAPDFKDDMKRYRDHLLDKIVQSEATLATWLDAERGFVEAHEPDALVLAVGAQPAWPDIPGVDPASCVWAGDVFTGKAETGGRVVVVGDGGVACEAALVLALQGKQVAIIELPGGSEQDQTVNFVDMSMLLELLDEQGIRVRKGVVLESVADGVVRTVDQVGAAGEIATDTVVLALNLRPRLELIDQLKDLAPEVHVVGDCKAPRALFAAVHEGFEAALEIGLQE